MLKSGKLKENLICSGLGVIIGIMMGVICGIFGQILDIIEEVRAEHYKLLVPFMGFAGAAIIFLYKKISPNSEQGLNLAIAYNMGEVDNEGHIRDFGHAQKIGKFPTAYIALKLVTNMIMLLFGASTGKEGTVAACGAAAGDYVARLFKCRRYSRALLISGVAAGVAGLFQTPIGGIFFALEFTAAGVLFYNALIPAFISAYTAYFTSKLLGYHAFCRNIPAPELSTDPKTIILIIVCAVIFGLCGRLFVESLSHVKSFYSHRVKNRYIGIIVIGTIIALMLTMLCDGRYCGTGASMVSELFGSGTFNMYDFALKFIFTVVCVTIGFTGGEMMPLMAIGAALGATMSAITGLPMSVSIVMGCTAVYCSATNTLLAPIFIGIEMFGSGCAAYIAAACFIAFAINGNRSVYSMQANTPHFVYGRMKK